MPYLTQAEADAATAAGVVFADGVARAAASRIATNFGLFDDSNSYDFYLHPLGNDLDHGRTKGAPFRNMSAVIAAAGSQAGVKVGVGSQAGALSQYRGSANRIPAQSLQRLTIGRWGQGTRPQFVGSTRIASAWTLGTNGEYSTPIAYTPLNVFRQVASTVAAPVGLITKLYPTTASPGSIPVGRWAITGTSPNFTLYVNTGTDPNADYIEVTDNVANPTTNALANCFYPAAGATIQDVDIMMWPGSGAIVIASDVSFLRTEVSYVGNDGIDTAGKVQNILLKDGVSRSVGRIRGVDTGEGDAVSFHENASGLIDGWSFYNNDRSGVGNQSSSRCRTTRCYFEGNFRSWAVYGANDGDGTTGQHDADYNVFRRGRDDETMAVVLDGSGLEVNGKFHNNTLFNPAERNAMSVMLGLTRNSTGTIDVKNCLLSSSTQSVAGIAQYATMRVEVDYSTIVGFNATYQSGFLPAVRGSNVITAGPVSFVNAAGGNYGLQASSASRATGVALGYTKDFFGNPVPAVNPDRGAIQRL